MSPLSALVEASCGACGAAASSSGDPSVPSAPSSSAGFTSSSSRTACWCSRRDSWSSLIACCSWGVITSCWLSFRDCRSSSAIHAPSRSEGEAFPQVDFPDPVRRGDLPGGPREQDLSLGDDVGTVANLEGIANVMIRYYNADAALF